MLTSITESGQVEVLRELRRLCFPDARTILDPTWGKGGFYTLGECIGTDLNPSRALHAQADYTNLPFKNKAFDLVIFDPPFQPKTSSIKIARMEKCFSRVGYNIAELKTNIQAGACECYRVSRLGVIIKIQDYIHNHKFVCMSSWLLESLGDPYDCVHVKQGQPKIQGHNWSRQLSVRRNNFTFWVFRRGSVR